MTTITENIGKKEAPLDILFNIEFFEEELDVGYYTALSKALIYQFHRKFLDALEEIVDEVGLIDEYVEYFRDLNKKLCSIENNINVKNEKEYEIVKSIVDIKELFIKKSIEAKELGKLARTCFYLEEDLEYTNLI